MPAVHCGLLFFKQYIAYVRRVEKEKVLKVIDHRGLYWDSHKISTSIMAWKISRFHTRVIVIPEELCRVFSVLMIFK
jgi:hypothetical protein